MMSSLVIPLPRENSLNVCIYVCTYVLIMSTGASGICSHFPYSVLLTEMIAPPVAPLSKHSNSLVTPHRHQCKLGQPAVIVYSRQTNWNLMRRKLKIRSHTFIDSRLLMPSWTAGWTCYYRDISQREGSVFQPQALT